MSDIITRPQGIQLRRTKGWRLPEGAVVVSRPSIWGNPFKIGEPIKRDSPLWPYIAETCPGGPGGLESLSPLTAQLAVDLHTAWFIETPAAMLTVAEELAGHDLACWCPLGTPCHRDFLLAVANGWDDEDES